MCLSLYVYISFYVHYILVIEAYLIFRTVSVYTFIIFILWKISQKRKFCNGNSIVLVSPFHCNYAGQHSYLLYHKWLKRSFDDDLVPCKREVSPALSPIFMTIIKQFAKRILHSKQLLFQKRLTSAGLLTIHQRNLKGDKI